MAVARDVCPALLAEATRVTTTSAEALRLFSKCSFLEGNINTFMAYYRAHYPEATVIPKMHLLEDHMVPWLRRWHMATGLMGEQGAESLHAHLHKLENRFSGVVNDLDRLEYVVREHNVQAAPELRGLQPPPRKWQRRS